MSVLWENLREKCEMRRMRGRRQREGRWRKESRRRKKSKTKMGCGVAEEWTEIEMRILGVNVDEGGGEEGEEREEDKGKENLLKTTWWET